MSDTLSRIEKLIVASHPASFFPLSQDGVLALVNVAKAAEEACDRITHEPLGALREALAALKEEPA